MAHIWTLNQTKNNADHKADSTPHDHDNMFLKTRYCPLCIARCDLLAAIFVMLKILRLLFVARIELFNNNGRLAPVKTKTTTEARKA